jgi:AraC family chemosensory pili system transcriptional regulator ChpD
MTDGSKPFAHFGRLDRIELHHGRYEGLGFPKHSHDEYVIGLNYSGLEQVWLEGKSFDVPPGLITVYNPGEIQASGCSTAGGWEFKSLYLDAQTVSSALGEDWADGTYRPVEQPLIDDPLLLAQFNQLDTQALAADADGQRSLTLDFIGGLFTGYGRSKQPARIERSHPAIRRVIDYIHDHLAEAIRLEDLALLADLSPYHLLRAYRNATGLPPHQYQLQLRIRHAKQMLRAGQTIADIAADLGFVDQGHLHHLFRRIVGVTPGQYRRGFA